MSKLSDRMFSPTSREIIQMWEQATENPKLIGQHLKEHDIMRKILSELDEVVMMIREVGPSEVEAEKDGNKDLLKSLFWELKLLRVVKNTYHCNDPELFTELVAVRGAN